MLTLNPTQVSELLAIASGNVSYISDANFLGVKSTAIVPSPGIWRSKRYASDVMAEIRQAEIAAIPKPPRLVATGKRAEPYTGPFPRKKHSHKCINCDDRPVACYKSKCTRPHLTSVCWACKGV